MKENQYPSLAGKIVFVTGAASGIGAAQAEAFLKQGSFVFGLDKQAGTMGNLKEIFPETFDFMQGDITKTETLRLAVAACEKKGAIDILLNTAGILDGYKKLDETSEEHWDLIYETNVKSLYRLTRCILPSMLERKQGTIINMASIAGFVAGGGGIAYTTAKHAIIGFTKQLALDYAAEGIQVKGIAPGAIRTPMNAEDFTGTGEMAAWVADETPVKRWAEPEEVAELTLFLATPQANYIQGAVVPIDGGWLLK
ncbi:oxidoreductase, short chain dehydrogenase/reductase family protein [Enterococcus faecalis 13-SD-W-01]|nr:oxidoreductase, short chain dehydrogenase/reductase family protein [Enterococcus faecalis 13-SD-W-01]